MANSYVEYTTASNSGTGTNGLGQKTFTVPTNFININDIVAKGYNGSAWTELTIASRGTTTVELSAIPTGYATVRFFRRSTTEPLVDFQTGATLSESDLDTAYRQGLYVAQEVAEDADPDGGSGIGNISNSQLAGGITNDKLAGSITNDKLSGGITNAQLAGSIADDKLASGVGTSANNLVKLDSSARLPAVDGSQLTGLASTASNTPYFYGKKTVDQTITRNTTTIVTGFTSNEIDTDNAFDGQTFTVPSGKAGVYFFNANITSNFSGAGNDGERAMIQFRKNGSNTGMALNDFTKGSGYNISQYTNQCSTMINLSVGDTVEITIYNKDGNASGSATASSASFFMGFKLI